MQKRCGTCQRLFTVLCLFAWLPCSRSFADENPGPTECRWCLGQIVIDGKPDEPDWASAPWIDTFGLPWLGETARPPRTSTRAKLLWDRQNLYFFADLVDADLFADVTEHDGKTWSNDVFELFFKPAEQSPGYYEFQVNAAGTVLDMFLPRRDAGGYERFRADGKFHLETKVSLRGTINQRHDIDQGWSVEGRIPWTDFARSRGRPNPGDEWKFALCRYDFSVGFERPELSTNMPTSSKPRADFHATEDYATLKFVGPADADGPRLNLRFRPTKSTVIGSPEPPPAYRVARAYPNLSLDFPIAIAHQPDTNRLLVIQQDRPYGKTRLTRFVDQQDVQTTETLLEMDETAYGLTFHPDFADNGLLFIGCNGPVSAPSEQKRTQVWRYAIKGEPPGTIDPEGRKLIIEWPSDGHNGGDVTFGLDGMLYVTSGDGTSDSDTNLRGQGLNHLLAKLLRIDVDHPDQGRMYGIPSDNPFVDTPGARRETWAYGLRNPWRITTDRKTGHIWVGNNGQDLFEQAYLIKRGANYGWSVYEGSEIFYADRQRGPTPLVPPTVQHDHSEARSLTGGIVYYGTRYPELRGSYIYGDYSTGKIWVVKHDGQQLQWHRELADSTLQITGFGVDSRGEILIADHRGNGEGGLYELVPNDALDKSSEFPRRLSETGLFDSLPGHQVAESLIPYSVNAPLWSDGAYKLRYLALSENDSKIDVSPDRGWNFPERTVIVKSFALQRQAADPNSRRWIETRLLTKQQGEWVGYTYAWNDQQTEAFLVDEAGMDHDFEIDTGEGVRTQTWHYPSRAECMVCHTRAANYVLGLSRSQLNKPHDYDGQTRQQLEVWEELGILDVNWTAEARAAIRKSATDAGMSGDEATNFVATQTAQYEKSQEIHSPLFFKPPTEYPHLVDPYDRELDVAERARSYLHSNCSNCHVPAGGGNAAMDLDFGRPLGELNVVDVLPLHDKFDLSEPRLIAPGAPERSVLLHRMALRGRGQMPQLSTAMIDERAVDLLRTWIISLAGHQADQ